MSYASYLVQDTEVIVGSRPAAAEIDVTFYRSVSAWVSVTDRIPAFLVGDAPCYWFPYVEFRSHNLFESPPAAPTKECLYTTLMTLDRLIKARTKRVYMHCDAGTHRAPLLFGLYLRWFQTPDAAEIVKKVVLVGRDHNSCPIHYSKCHLNDYPDDVEYLTWISTKSGDDAMEKWFRLTPIERLKVWYESNLLGEVVLTSDFFDDLFRLGINSDKNQIVVTWHKDDEDSFSLRTGSGPEDLRIVTGYGEIKREIKKEMIR